MSEWKPIKTKPRDNQLFLIYVPSAKRRRVTVSSGAESGENWFVQGRYTVFDDRGNAVRATHWMPLPEPPQQEPSNE